MVALALPTPQPERSADAASAPLAPAPSPLQGAAATQGVPVIRTVSAPAQAAASPARKVYKADPPMSNEELREWEKRNREAMKILEKTTPELEKAPTR